MIINVEYYYEQRYLPTMKHKKEKTRLVKEAAQVNINEISEKDFPVAFVVHDLQDVADGWKEYGKMPEPKRRMLTEEIRMLDGKLYRPVRFRHGAAVSADPIPLMDGDAAKELGLSGYAPYGYKKDTDFDPKKSVVMSDDGILKKDALLKLKTKASHIYICNGAFWAQTAEPMYVVKTYGLGYNHAGTAIAISYGYDPNGSRSDYFTALQRGEALVQGRQIAKSRGDHDCVGEMGMNTFIDVLMPEMVKSEPNREQGRGDPIVNALERMIKRSGNVESAMTAGLRSLLNAVTSNPAV